MKALSDDLLIESYLRAKKLKLKQEFIYIIEKEMRKRDLIINKNSHF